MIFDATNLFSDAQAVTASAASTNVIDLGAAQTPKHGAQAVTKDLGKGNPVGIRIQVVEDFATLTSLAVALQKDTVEGFGSPETVISLATVAAADLVAGYVFPLETLPRGADQRYLRLNYTVTGSNATAGKITAGLVFANEQLN